MQYRPTPVMVKPGTPVESLNSVQVVNGQVIRCMFLSIVGSVDLIRLSEIESSLL